MSTAPFNGYPSYPLAFDRAIRSAGVAEQLRYTVGGDVNACYYKYRIDGDPEPPGPAVEVAYSPFVLGGSAEFCTFFEGASVGRVTVTLPDGRRLTRTTTPAPYEGARFGQLSLRLAPGDPLGVYQISLETRDGLLETAFDVLSPQYSGMSILNLEPAPVPHSLPSGESGLLLGIFGFRGETARSVHIYEAADPQQMRDGAVYLNTIVVPLDAMGNGGAVLPLTQAQAGKAYVLWCGDPEQLNDPLVGTGTVPEVSPLAESAVVVVPAA